jgi:hypothetical protein
LATYNGIKFTDNALRKEFISKFSSAFLDLWKI